MIQMARTSALIVLLVACASRRVEAELRDGDLIFHTSKSAQSLAIQRATRSPYSHMGMVVFRGDKPFVFEASTTVRLTPLSAWTNRGVGGRYVVKRLRDSEQITPHTMEKARVLVRKFQGKSYDLTFEWSDTRMYCSELVWKIYERVLGIRIGDLQKLRDFHLTDPVVQAKLRERHGTDVPLDEPVISPVAMFESPLLETVAERSPAQR